MKLTRDDVRRVAVLARLRLTAEEESRLTNELDTILQYMTKLDQLDTSQFDPMVHAVEMVHHLREDKITSQPSPEAILANAPAREDSFFKVPKILE
jgi:aspartyl-tRNA(Asn)/glutamyl-tRNA(Gln) amidotransferase subunit C